MAVALTRPGEDFTGGESVFVEQRARAQSRASVAMVPHGHAVVIANDRRPVPAKHGWQMVSLRHGVSTVHSGQRVVLGIIFHDAV
ncbi:MAG: hypothetical protein JWL70_3124 [Acidimicrobiia bacterium]|nr:hypothetical protein [Acidimicrobiia bacterium]